ncbi:hypothetical protein NUW58_g4687 [Xylaria curta]|uniref:Uncharacterized protein n=1 Tax=Xylaria curta TaxID=42375 RepID=A0ACC1P805_9PEZI|nr:hypothetical protein NUW58_g4687 [Xylaria curta]
MQHPGLWQPEAFPSDGIAETIQPTNVYWQAFNAHESHAAALVDTRKKKQLLGTALLASITTTESTRVRIVDKLFLDLSNDMPRDSIPYLANGTVETDADLRGRCVDQLSTLIWLCFAKMYSSYNLEHFLHTWDTNAHGRVLINPAGDRPYAGGYLDALAM